MRLARSVLVTLLKGAIIVSSGMVHAALPVAGRLAIPDAQSVAVEGNVAYVCGNGGISVVNIANPAQPALVRTIPGTFADCVVRNHLLIATTGLGPFNLQIYSTRQNPQNPNPIGNSTPIQYALQGQLAATETHAFTSLFSVCWNQPGYDIYFQGGDLLSMALNLNNPSAPNAASPVLSKVLWNTHGDLTQNIANEDKSGCSQSGGDYHVWRIAQADANTLYLASTTVSGSNTQSGAGVIRIVDISSPGNPDEVGSLTIPGTVHVLAVAVDGKRALAVGSTAGWLNPNAFNPSPNGTQLLLGNLVLAVLDLSDTRSPQIVKTETLTRESRTFWSNILALGNNRYAFSNIGGASNKDVPQILTIDASDPTNLRAEATDIPHLLGGRNAMASAGGLLYTATKEDGLSVYGAVAPGELDLSVNLTDTPDPVGVGNQLSYTAEIVNNGPKSATGVRLSIELASTVTLVSMPAGCAATGTTVDCAIGNLAAGEKTARVVVAKAGTPGGVSAIAYVSAQEADSASSNNQATAVTGVATTSTQALADLAISLRGPKNPRLGKKAVYNLTVQNKSKVPATQTMVFGQVPKNVKLTKVPAICQLTGDVLSCNLGTLPKKAKLTSSLKTRMTRSGPISVTANVISNGTADPNPGNNTARIDINVK